MKTAVSKRYGLIIFCMIMMMICWEYQGSNPALAQFSIPEESIRLRILANSDLPHDQWVKRKVRDEIVKHMDAWVQTPQDIDAARQEVVLRLEDFHDVVHQVLQTYGYDDSVQVEFGVVDFPAKLYGNQLYPAGDYEALKVTIGAGKGRNWWCVLFPPLCFVEVAHAEAVLPEAGPSGDGDSSTDSATVRFFIVDLLKSLAAWLKGWFV